MNKIWKTVIGGIILIALGSYVYFWEVKGHEERLKQEEEAKKILSFDEKAVKEVELKYEDVHLRFKKVSDDKWEITEPVTTDGDSEAIKKLLAVFKDTQRERELDLDVSKPEEFGLDEPTLDLRITTDKNVSELSLGKQNPAGSLIYAKREGSDKIFLVTVHLLHHLKTNLLEVRDKQLIRAEEPQVTQLELKYPDKEVRLELDAEEGWKVTAPYQAKGDREDISAYLNRLDSLRAKEFAAESSEDLSQYGLDKPALQVSVYTGSEKLKQTLFFGKTEPEKGIYAKAESKPQVALVDDAIASTLFSDAFDLRDRRILEFDRSLVAMFQMDCYGQVIVIGKEKDEWRIIKPEDAPAKPYFIDGMLYDLENLKAEAYLEPEEKPEFGFDDPVMKISIWLADQTDSLDITLGTITSDEQIYVRREKDAQIFLVSEDILRQLSKQPGELKREVVEPPKKAGAKADVNS